MTQATRLDVSRHTVGIDRSLRAALVPAQPDPPVPVDGMTFGVAVMDRNAPHGGEMHPDGDEVLYLVAGRVRVVLLDESGGSIDMGPGDGLVVPGGVWHRVDVLEPCTIVYLTPGPNNAFRPLESEP